MSRHPLDLHPLPHKTTGDTHPEAEIDLGTLLGTLWRGKGRVFLLGLVGLMLSAWYVFEVAQPLYRAQVVVMLDVRETQVSGLDAVVTGLTGEAAEVNTELHVLQSRNLMAKVVDTLALTEDPEFNPTLAPPPAWRGWLGLPRAQPTAQDTRDIVVNRLIDRTDIQNSPQSFVFTIGVLTQDRDKSARIATTLADLYILDQLEAKFEATRKTTAWLSDRVADLKLELEAAEQLIEDFSARSDLISIDGLTNLERQLKDQHDLLANAEEQRTTILSRRNELLAFSGADRQTRAAVAADVELSGFLRRIRVPGDAMTAAFEARFAQVVSLAELDVQRAQAHIEALQAGQSALEAQIEAQSQDLVTLQQLQREAQATSALYEFFLNRLKETRVQEGIQQADSRIIADAMAPIEPTAPKRAMTMVLMTTLGLMLGAIWVILREAGQKGFRTARALSRHTGYTVMGQIPKMASPRRGKLLAHLTQSGSSALIEAVRNLRTSVLMTSSENPPQILMLTSSVPGEGKTTQSIALAQNLAALGHKVLLIEGDVRRSVFGSYFKLKGKAGLWSAIKDNAAFSALAQHDPRTGVDILQGEAAAQNAADIFASEGFAHLLASLRQHYDHVVIDTPPVLAVPDARVIASHCDAILYVVRWDHTSHAQVTEGLAQFESLDLSVTGLILSQIDPKGMKRYGHGGPGGSYYGATGHGYYGKAA